MSLSLTGNFSGGNPQCPNCILEGPESVFTIYPESEKEDYPAYKFRLDIIAFNPNQQPASIVLRVDWQEPLYMHLRNTLYIRNSDLNEWQSIPAVDQSKVTVVEFRLTIPPGQTDISSQPRYGEKALNALAAFGLQCPDLTIRLFSTGDSERPLLVFDFRRYQRSFQTALLVMARIHPYETAGSYCLDGAIRTLVSDDKLRKKLLKSSDLILVPIAAPEGVAKGLCRLNGNNGTGIDMARHWHENDPTCKMVKTIANHCNPIGYMEIHNWMHPDVDGIKYTHLYDTWRFIRQMRSLGAVNKPWRKFNRYGILPTPYFGLKKWVSENTTAKCLMVEYPWCSRSIQSMAELGLKTINAFQQILK